MSEPITQEVRDLERKKTVEHYDRVYCSHGAGTAQCALSLHDIRKARSRVRLLCDYFGLILAKKRCLDVGSGLGYYTDALSPEVGDPGLVIGLDASPGATKAAKDRFPDVNFHTGFFPDALAGAGFFDLIIAMDLSLINSFDANKINRDFVWPAMNLLRPGGSLVVGWHTDFSGDYRGMAGVTGRKKTSMRLRTRADYLSLRWFKPGSLFLVARQSGFVGRCRDQRQYL